MSLIRKISRMSVNKQELRNQEPLQTTAAQSDLQRKELPREKRPAYNRQGHVLQERKRPDAETRLQETTRTLQKVAENPENAYPY